MPCYQPSALPGGVSTTGRTSYRTEAECNQACKEGACCEGTSCSVKPACQCQCTSGSCCGPDTITVDGTTGPQCRGGTKAECDQRGGLWVCGFACSVDEKTGLGTCSSVMMSNPNAPVFKGVGTVCSPNPCCSCESLVSVTVKLPAVLGGSQITRAGCNGTITANSTLLNWACTSSGFTIGLMNVYQTRSDGSCEHPAYFASRSYTVNVAATSQSGPCAGVVVSGCAAASFLAATTLAKSDFTALPSRSEEFDNSLPLSCWGFGSPLSEVLFPEWVSIGSATNPLP